MMKVMKMMDLKKTFLLSLTLVTVSTVSIRSAEHSVRERRQVSNGGLLTDNEDGFSIKSFIKQLYPDRVKSVSLNTESYFLTLKQDIFILSCLSIFVSKDGDVFETNWNRMKLYNCNYKCSSFLTF